MRRKVRRRERSIAVAPDSNPITIDDPKIDDMIHSSFRTGNELPHVGIIAGGPGARVQAQELVDTAQTRCQPQLLLRARAFSAVLQRRSSLVPLPAYCNPRRRFGAMATA